MKTNRILILLVGSIVLTVLSAIITHYAVNESRNRVQWVFHTYTVIGKANELLWSFKDAETTLQSFLVTNDSSYFKSYQEASTRLPDLIDTLRHLIADNDQQMNLFQSQILPQIDLNLKALNENSKAYNQSKDDVVQPHDKGKNKAIMASLQQLLTQFNNNEQALLQSRLAHLAETHQRQIIIRNICFSVIGVVSLLALITIVQKQNKNDELINRLNLTNETLEQKIAARTSELRKQNNLVEELNEQLRQTMEEIETFYEALQIRNAKTEDTLTEIRDLYDHAPNGYHSLDAEGTIIRMNETELRWLGYSSQEVIGKLSIKIMLLPEEHESYSADFSRFKQDGFIRNKKHTFVRKDGSTFPILLNATAIYDQQGQYRMSRGTVIDITELSLMEKKLLELNQKLIHLNAEKNHFLGIAAHDLKSPLNNVLGLINLLDGDKHNLNPKQLEYLHYMQQSCISMQTLINNLLDINRIELGLHEIKMEEVALNDLLHRQIRVFGEMAKKKNITILLEDNAPGAKINSDPNALHRILDNLISNALKFSPKNQEIILRIIRVNTFIKIEVIDRGPGIRDEELPKLFKKFQRLSARPTNGESSTGLGLSIVKELVQILNGNIYVESEVNKGSRFIVELPA